MNAEDTCTSAQFFFTTFSGTPPNVGSRILKLSTDRATEGTL